MDNFGFTPRTENQSFPVSPLRKSISNTPFSWVMTRASARGIECDRRAKVPTGRHEAIYPDFPSPMLETVIRVAVIAEWRARMPLLRNSNVSVGPYLGLVSEAVAWHCFAIQSPRAVRVVESRRDGM